MNVAADIPHIFYLPLQYINRRFCLKMREDARRITEQFQYKEIIEEEWSHRALKIQGNKISSSYFDELLI